jgi:acetyl esterase/lipase
MFKKALVPTLICGVALFFSFIMNAQTVIPLYTGEIPNSRTHTNDEISGNNADGVWIVSKVSRPALTIFLPPKSNATGAAIIICPGGGYTNLAMGYEGEDVARRYNESGIAAFVLKYRIPDDSTMMHKETGPIEDAQRAIQILRSRAGEWGIDPDRIGIMGFSAGGHLASTAGTHFNKEYIPNPDHISLRPDFMILVYPVLSFKSPVAHMGSVNNLLGPHPSPEKIKEFSNEEQVTDHTPPAFLVHAKDDKAVPCENSTVFAEALRKHHIPVEVYLYEKGGHGFGMNNRTSETSWMDLSIRWLGKEHFLK